MIGRRLLSEGLGTAILVATVVGSGIMAERLAGGNLAIALLGNTIPTGADTRRADHDPWAGVGRPLQSGRDLVFAARREIAWRDVLPYVAVQCAGGVAGTAIAHLMFDLAPLAIGTTARSGASQWLAEAVATFTLVLAILGGIRHAPQAVPWLVGLTITAAYWFTASTSFANPAVTLARGFTTTFAGIAINHVPGFVVAQLIGAAVALVVVCLPVRKAGRLEPRRQARVNPGFSAAASRAAPKAVALRRLRARHRAPGLSSPRRNAVTGSGDSRGEFDASQIAMVRRCRRADDRRNRRHARAGADRRRLLQRQDRHLHRRHLARRRLRRLWPAGRRIHAALPAGLDLRGPQHAGRRPHDRDQCHLRGEAGRPDHRHLQHRADLQPAHQAQGRALRPREDVVDRQGRQRRARHGDRAAVADQDLRGPGRRRSSR